MEPASTLAGYLAEATPYSPWEIQEVLHALGERQGADLIETAHRAGIKHLVSTARAMKHALERRQEAPLGEVSERCGTLSRIARAAAEQFAAAASVESRGSLRAPPAASVSLSP